MKVEAPSDVQTIRPPDQPAVSQTFTSASAKGVDELTHLFNQEVEKNSQSLGQRKMILRVLPIKAVAQMYRHLRRPHMKSLASLSFDVRDALRKGGGVDELLKLSEDDPALAFLVLNHVADQAGTEATLARDAMTKLEVGYLGQIQVGLKIATALEASDLDPAQVQALRTLYYASVVARQSLSTIMQSLLGVFGEKRLSDGLKMMQKALASEIEINRPKSSTPLLITLLQGLQACMQLSGALAGCRELLRSHGIEYDVVGLLQRLLGYVGSGITTVEILRLGHDLGGASGLRQLVALNALHPMIKQLPLAFWLDSQVRDDSLRGFQTVIGEMDRIARSPAGFTGDLGRPA